MNAQNNAYSDLSLWFDNLGELAPMEQHDLPSDTEVAIIGAGFTGLWSAYYLKQMHPQLDITIVEAQTPGFGASGRNGGWCMGEAAGLEELLANPDTRQAGLDLQRQMLDTVDEIGRVCQAENIEAHYAKGGWLRVARHGFQVQRLQNWIASKHDLGFDESDFRWLAPEEAGARLSYAARHGAAYARHCAVLQPALLARGLAHTVRRLGVKIIENTPALELKPGEVTTTRGTLATRHLLRATEAYTRNLRGHSRTMLPMYSMIVATEPLPAETWHNIGLAERERYNDPRRLVIYGQRTLDDRLMLGGRAGYEFGSGIRRSIGSDNAHVQSVESTLRDLFPQLRDFRVTHHWGGVLGIPRHWRPCVSYDPQSGMGWAGGYVGEGVAASNLAGRTLADLVLRRDTERTRLPWVQDVPRRWEFEPLRWVGTHTLRWMNQQADAAEERTGQAARSWHWITG